MPRRAYIGKTVPVGWDYNRESAVGLPNPVLENVVGLLLCYDELWFPSLEFCPEDMRGLPYVHFVDQVAPQKALATEAMVQAHSSPELRELSAEIGSALDADAYRALSDRYRSIDEFQLLLDNHSRGSSELGMGNSSDPGLWVEDVVVAAALDVELEVVVNGLLARAINSTIERSGAEGNETTAHRISFAENVIGIHTVDYLTPHGAYHPSLEDLRNHQAVSEFRNYISETNLLDRDLVELAHEVEVRAADHRNRIMERFVKGRHKLESFGGPALGVAGNLLQPGVGTVLRSAITANRWLKDRSLKRELQWALFKSYSEYWKLQQEIGARRS